MTSEELEKIKKDHDYCIIPIEKVIGIEDNMPVQGYKLRTINIDSNNGEPCQFVNSDYFRTWGKGVRFEKRLTGEEPTIVEHLKNLIELLEEREKESPSLIWLTAPRKNNGSEEE